MSEPETAIHFDRPPLVEVVCGVVYARLPLSAAHVGLLWQRYGDDFPKTADKPAVRRMSEDAQGQVAIDLTELPRVWFVSDDARRIVQFQPDRLHFNWRKVAEDDEYPRFPAVYGEFLRHRATLDAFLTDAEVSPTHATEYELTYVNRIPCGPAFAGIAEIGAVLPDLAWRAVTPRFLPPPDRVQASYTFPLPDGAGQLWVTVRTVRRRQDGELELAMDLTARGAVGAFTADQWFDLAHTWIVGAFADLTGRDVQQSAWRVRRQA